MSSDIQESEVLITSKVELNHQSVSKEKIEHRKSTEKLNDERKKSDECTISKNVNGSENKQLSDSPIETLKILDHLKNIETINNKRLEVLNNTITKFDVKPQNGLSTDEMMKKVPPPKPPMLSRTRSLEHGRRSVTPTSSQTLPSLHETFATLPGVGKKNTHLVEEKNETVPEPELDVSSKKLDSGTEKEGYLSLRYQNNGDRYGTENSSENLTKKEQKSAGKAITANHYQYLIEDLKCPGCTLPMKAPTLLCKSGHTICEQCTRVLMTCPLCREPFTNIRSLTIESLCSKAHFRCIYYGGGCTVRLQVDVLSWHEKQCIYKPMNCFMGRVWGGCQWTGREIVWKEHLETDHRNKLFSVEKAELIWNMGVKQKPLMGYYVFQVFDEMFNFYEIFDKDRILFTMTITSTMKEKKYKFAYEVTILNRNNDALSIAQKFPMHSEYDLDVLQEGTCVSIQLADLAKFIDEERLLHYSVQIIEMKMPQQQNVAMRYSCPPQAGLHSINFRSTRIEGTNLKQIPEHLIITRKQPDLLNDANDVSSIGSNSNCVSENDGQPDTRAWSTPQLHFNRKYLRNLSSDVSIPNKENVPDDIVKDNTEDLSAETLSTSHLEMGMRRKISNSIRRSFRNFNFKMNVKPFSGNTPDKPT